MERQVNNLVSSGDNKHNTFLMNWERICKCISHELWTKLSSKLLSIIYNDENKINNNDISHGTIEKVLDNLNKRNDIDEKPKQYIKHLIHRSINFAPVTQSTINEKRMYAFIYVLSH